MKISFDLTNILGVVMAMSFLVNIIVQMTKGFIPIPTKMWCILVSVSVVMASLFVGISFHIVNLSAASVILSLIGSFIVAFISMYGFDTFKDLWQRFKAGEAIDEYNK